ncbi:MAG: hypothetical protein ACD_81C00231G0001 [uncultured bacterium]|nr:MAG: hypothetical protein ACD_81C00231G0001 [uncultured bacterium]
MRIRSSTWGGVGVMRILKYASLPVETCVRMKASLATASTRYGSPTVSFCSGVPAPWITPELWPIYNAKPREMKRKRIPPRQPRTSAEGLKVPALRVKPKTVFTLIKAVTITSRANVISSTGLVLCQSSNIDAPPEE